MNISVITVCFNSKDDLRKTLDSVLSQTYVDMEYLVVDGGSRDGSVDLLRAYESKFKAKGISFSFVSEKDNGT